MKSKDLRALPIEELTEKEAAAKKRGYELRVSNTTKELKNTAEIRSNRRDIARIKQAIAEKQNQATKA
ncbi:50S ribosomal protein L29 [Candidatus Sumerlaeota bacterium]|nr:50S ribosomal protein L29 [Candidatus Sumerlaeales bacterium]NLD61063.1 50S ribosomal protein L29 [Candidatus Sumerlaeota bacterium]